MLDLLVLPHPPRVDRTQRRVAEAIVDRRLHLRCSARKNCPQPPAGSSTLHLVLARTSTRATPGPPPALPARSCAASCSISSRRVLTRLSSKLPGFEYRYYEIYSAYSIVVDYWISSSIPSRQVVQDRARLAPPPTWRAYTRYVYRDTRRARGAPALAHPACMHARACRWRTFI